MVKAIVTAEDGVRVFLFDLSKVNIEKLQEGHPLMVDLRVLGGPKIRIAISYGETEESISQEWFEKLGLPKKAVDERQGG